MAFTPVLQPGEELRVACKLSIPVRSTLTVTDRRVIFSSHKEILAEARHDEIEDVTYDESRGRHTLGLSTADQIVDLVSKEPSMVQAYEAVSQAVVAAAAVNGVRNRVCGVALVRDTVVTPTGTCPLQGAKAEIITGSEMARRRRGDVATQGIGSIATMIRDRLEERQLFLVVTGQGVQAAVKLDPRRVEAARALVAAVTADQARTQPAPSAPSAPAPGAPAAEAPSEGSSHHLVKQVEALAELHRQGALTDEEFNAAKSRLFEV